GEITVVSQLGSGSEFTLTIPYMLTTTVNPEANGKAVLSAVYDHALEKTNLLVVDDDEMSMLLLSTILEKNGIPHKTAVDGKDAILKIKTNNFDLILTDVNMPEISGLDLLKQVKKNTGKKTPVPVIAITANINKNDVEKYKQSGFDAVLLKPYLEEDLLKLIYKYAHVEATEKKNGISSNGHRPAQEKETSFSLDQLNRISNGSEEFIIKMLEKFIVSAGECSENMEGAMAAKDWARLRTAAHKSIPSYSMMGLKDLTEKLQFIELNSRTGQEHEEIPGMVSFISEKNKKIISDIEQYLAVIAEKNKKIN
ncbi:MAG TPA: response regulator, partial [Bacteroidia bacterium]|nr:response regulator [Bacteroidia bacterium]